MMALPWRHCDDNMMKNRQCFICSCEKRKKINDREKESPACILFMQAHEHIQSLSHLFFLYLTWLQNACCSLCLFPVWLFDGFKTAHFSQITSLHFSTISFSGSLLLHFALISFVFPLNFCYFLFFLSLLLSHIIPHIPFYIIISVHLSLCLLSLNQLVAGHCSLNITVILMFCLSDRKYIRACISMIVFLIEFSLHIRLWPYVSECLRYVLLSFRVSYTWKAVHSKWHENTMFWPLLYDSQNKCTNK